VRALADGGRAVLLSSHVLSEVEEVSDQVLILVGGKLSREEHDGAQARPRFAFRVGGELGRAAAILRARAEVESVAEEEGLLVVALAPGTADAREAAAALVGAGVPLVELRRETETLRRRFARAVDRARGAS
jgi:ABC-type multidrug transport system ATPase subunit